MFKGLSGWVGRRGSSWSRVQEVRSEVWALPLPPRELIMSLTPTVAIKAAPHAGPSWDPVKNVRTRR